MLPLGTAIAPMFEPHSAGAQAISDLFIKTLSICGAIFVLVAVMVTICIVKFRERKGDAEPKQVHGHTQLEIGWTLGPIVIVTLLTILTAQTMNKVDPGEAPVPDITVIGHQWWWEVRYKSGAITANEIHIPVGKRLAVEVVSADVIHDFWVPQLARKIDATPGHPTQVWMEADAPGSYPGACAEFCGAQHAWMRFTVVAETPEEFAAWEQHQLAPAPIPAGVAEGGARSFHDRTCSRCHAIAQAGDEAMPVPPRYAPDLTHVAGRATLAAGVLTNTPENLGAWLKDPQSIKSGSHMPSLKLTDPEVNALVAYFETLK